MEGQRQVDGGGLLNRLQLKGGSLVAFVDWSTMKTWKDPGKPGLR
jgi:hypothetical protein